MGAEVFFPIDDPEALAAEHRRLGYRAAVCPDVPVEDTARVSAIEQAFAHHEVVVAEVWAWRNLLTPDAQARKANLSFVTHQMALAEAVGARCCVDVAGSFDGATLSGPHPENLGREFFDATVENCRSILDAVKPTRSCFTLEMKGWNLPDGPEAYLALVKAVDRRAFGVHMDPFNAINSPYRYYARGISSASASGTRALREVLSRQGPRVAAAGEERGVPRDRARARRDRLHRLRHGDRQVRRAADPRALVDHGGVPGGAGVHRRTADRAGVPVA